MRGDLLGRAACAALLAGALALASCAGDPPPPPAGPDGALPPGPAQAPPGLTTPPAASSAVAPSLPPADGAAAPAGSAGGSGRDQGDVQAIMATHRGKFRACYDEARKRTPTLRGSFVLTFTLNADGTLKQAAYARDKSEIKDDAMGDCALGALRAIGFPPSKRGMETTISYPFGFTPGGGGAP
ncbi:MAG TPA: AgmX/PglI C-terminal domain-containing protein [Polyangiaceae bacterium]|nr:AgmX/PglI C-terminal domain-containing protein [Polyangiaceae bacterium]